MYVCMYVCMYVRMYICMYVCVYVRTYVYMYVCMYVCMCICVYVCMYVCMHVCVCVCVCVRAYACMYVWLSLYQFTWGFDLRIVACGDEGQHDHTDGTPLHCVRVVSCEAFPLRQRQLPRLQERILTSLRALHDGFQQR